MKMGIMMRNTKANQFCNIGIIIINEIRQKLE